MKLYAIRYGVNFKYGTEGSVRLDAQNPNQLILEFPFFYYLAKIDDYMVLFDTGFRNPTLAKNMGVEFLPVEKEIQQLFGSNLDIKYIFITHSHWDHINNIDLYPDAVLIMTEATYQQVVLDGADAIKTYLQERKSSLYLVKESETVLNKFTISLVGGHTVDSSVIHFEHNNKVYCITGDECYLRDNMYHNIPIGISVDTKKNRAFLTEGHKEKWIPLPFHDSSIMNYYPRVSDNIVQIF